MRARTSISDRPMTRPAAELVTPTRREPDGAASMLTPSTVLLKESPVAAGRSPRASGRSPRSTADDSEALRREASAHEQTRRELQHAQRLLDERDAELVDARGELRSKRDVIEELDRRADEASRAASGNTQRLEQDSSELQEKVGKFQQENEYLEKALSDKIAFQNQLQQRHDEQLGAMGKRLAESEASCDRKSARLEQQRQEHQLDLDRQRQEHQQSAVTNDKASAGRSRPAQADKENRRLRDAMQEQKRVLADVESELRQEKQMACLPSPGDFARATRPADGESLSVQNARHVLKLKLLEHNLQVVARHLTPEARELAQTELEGAQSIEMLSEVNV